MSNALFVFIDYSLLAVIFIFFADVWMERETGVRELDFGAKVMKITT